MLTTIACCACTGATSGNAPDWPSISVGKRRKRKGSAGLAKFLLRSGFGISGGVGLPQAPEDKVACGFDFLGKDGGRTTWIALRLYGRAHGGELLRGLEHAAPGHVRIGISRTKQLRHSPEITIMVQIRTGRPD